MGNSASRKNDDTTTSRIRSQHLAKPKKGKSDAGVAATNNDDKVGNSATNNNSTERSEKQAIKTKTSIQSSSSSIKTSAAINVASSEESAAIIGTQNQRSRQQSTWSLGSLSGRLNWSFTGASRNFSRYRNKSTTSSATRKSFTSLQQRRSKTLWHKPLTNAIFSSHFKDTSRNEQFHIDCLIAKGAFGVVFKVIDKRQHQPELQLQKGINVGTIIQSSEQFSYALKVLKKSKIIEENSIQQIKNEADIQKLCGHHPFIVQQIDLWQNRRNLHILSEYVPNGELFSKILNFSIDLIRLYLAEIALAIDFLHNAGIIYRDAKPENILLTETYHIKLTDFGLSKWLKLGTTTKTICGTFQYIAPEILRGTPYGHAVDWWSLGIIACQMFTNTYPDMEKFLDATFPSTKSTTGLDVTDDVAQIAMLDEEVQVNAETLPTLNFAMLEESSDFLPPQVEDLPHAASDVIKRLLEFDPKKRIRSVLTLQRIALYQNYKIDSKHLLSISPINIISKDNLRIISMNLEAENSSTLATKAFQEF